MRRGGVAVVSDFRPADMAVVAGRRSFLTSIPCCSAMRRSGALCRSWRIANLTAVPAGPRRHNVRLRYGPGNMVIDAATEALFGIV